MALVQQVSSTYVVPNFFIIAGSIPIWRCQFNFDRFRFCIAVDHVVSILIPWRSRWARLKMRLRERKKQSKVAFVITKSLVNDWSRLTTKTYRLFFGAQMMRYIELTFNQIHIRIIARTLDQMRLKTRSKNNVRFVVWTHNYIVIPRRIHRDGKLLGTAVKMWISMQRKMNCCSHCHFCEWLLAHNCEIKKSYCIRCYRAHAHRRQFEYEIDSSEQRAPILAWRAIQRHFNSVNWSLDSG